MTTKLSKKAEAALDVLKKGGKFYYHSDSECRLRDVEGTIVSGFSTSVLKKLNAAGLTEPSDISDSMTVFVAKP